MALYRPICTCDSCCVWMPSGRFVWWEKICPKNVCAQDAGGERYLSTPRDKRKREEGPCSPINKWRNDIVPPGNRRGEEVAIVDDLGHRNERPKKERRMREIHHKRARNSASNSEMSFEREVLCGLVPIFTSAFSRASVRRMNSFKLS